MTMAISYRLRVQWPSHESIKGGKCLYPPGTLDFMRHAIARSKPAIKASGEARVQPRVDASTVIESKRPMLLCHW